MAPCQSHLQRTSHLSPLPVLTSQQEKHHLLSTLMLLRPLIRMDPSRLTTGISWMAITVPKHNHSTSGLGELSERRLEIGTPNPFVLVPAGRLHGRRLGLDGDGLERQERAQRVGAQRHLLHARECRKQEPDDSRRTAEVIPTQQTVDYGTLLRDGRVPFFISAPAGPDSHRAPEPRPSWERSGRG